MDNLTILAGSLLFAPALWAGVLWTEAGDAGELPGTAQAVTGSPGESLDGIQGVLDDLGGGVDDIDLFRIRIVDPETFSVTYTGNLSVDNDTQLFLFDLAGSLVLFNDDGTSGFEPEFLPGNLSGASPGEYLLGLNLHSTMPADDPLTGWNRDPFPFQFGEYELSLTGAMAVPEPQEWLLLGSLGLVGWSVFRRFARRG